MRNPVMKMNRPVMKYLNSITFSGSYGFLFCDMQNERKPTFYKCNRF